MRGIDVSHYQDGLNIASIQKSGFDFAILKITEGVNVYDGLAPYFYMQARQANIPTGGYCYSHALTPEEARDEAKAIIARLSGFPMPLGLYLDMEDQTQLALSNKQLQSVALAWCEEIEKAGYIPGIYGSEGTLWAKLDPDALDENVIVWVAHYGKQPDVCCDLWQSSDSGKVDGYNGPVDTDEVRSSRFASLVYAYYYGNYQEQHEDADNISLAKFAAFLKTEEFKKTFHAWEEKVNVR